MEQNDFLDMLARDGFAPPVEVVRATDRRACATCRAGADL
jgi:hypothetical protein